MYVSYKADIAGIKEMKCTTFNLVISSSGELVNLGMGQYGRVGFFVSKRSQTMICR